MSNEMKTNEILTCLLFVIIGYFVASLFSRLYGSRNGLINGFSVGVPRDDMDVDGDTCENFYDNEDDCEDDEGCESTHYRNGEFKQCITREEDMNDYCENIDNKKHCDREHCTWKSSEGCVWVDEDEDDDDLMAELEEDIQTLEAGMTCDELDKFECVAEIVISDNCKLSPNKICIGMCSSKHGGPGRCRKCHHDSDPCKSDVNCNYDSYTELCNDIEEE